MLTAEQANESYFRQAYRTGEHGWGVEEPDPYALAFLKSLERKTPSGNLLDMGCGEGRHAIAAAKLGFHATAIDFEPLALRRARRFAKAQGAKQVRFRKASVFDLPFRENAFDIALDYGCLHHQKKADWRGYRTTLLRVLKPEGFYALSVFAPEFFLFHGSRRPWHIAGGAYRRYFTLEELHGLFGAHFEFLEEHHEPRGFWHLLMQRTTPIP